MHWRSLEHRHDDRRDRAARYQSAAEVSTELRAFLEGHHTMSPIAVPTGPPADPAARPLRATRATDADGRPLPISSVHLTDDGALVVRWSDGREQRVQSIKP